MICKQCGQPVEADQNFCVSCGAAVEEGAQSAETATQAVCKQCGKEIAADARFCVSCGAPINASATAASESSFKKMIREGTKRVKDLPELLGGQYTQKGAISLAWKQLALGLCFVFMIIFWYLPCCLRAETFGINIGFSFAAPFTDTAWSQIVSMSGGLKAVKILVTFFAILLDILPMMAAAVLSFLPLCNGTVMRRRTFLFQMIIAGLSFVRVFLNWVLYALVFVIVKDDLGVALGVGMDIGGWIIMILSAGAIVLSLFAAGESKKTCEK